MNFLNNISYDNKKIVIIATILAVICIAILTTINNPRNIKNEIDATMTNKNKKEKLNGSVGKYFVFGLVKTFVVVLLSSSAALYINNNFFEKGSVNLQGSGQTSYPQFIV
jgi:hypothetical protein